MYKHAHGIAFKHTLRTKKLVHTPSNACMRVCFCALQAYVMAAQSRHEALQSRERVAEHMYRRKELVLLRECFYALAGEVCVYVCVCFV